MKRKRRGSIGVEAIVESQVGAIYSRGAWMKELDDRDKEKQQTQRSKVKRKQL